MEAAIWLIGGGVVLGLVSIAMNLSDLAKAHLAIAEALKKEKKP